MAVCLRKCEETEYSSSLSAKKETDLFIEKQLDLISVPSLSAVFGLPGLGPDLTGTRQRPNAHGGECERWRPVV